MTDALKELLKTHRIEKGKAHYSIYLNIPDDFIYDVKNIVIKYIPETDTKTIHCQEIPDNIKENIYKFKFLKIVDFVNLFEENLTVFFIGKMPELKLPENELLLDGQLPNDYKFPIHNNFTTNITCDISKTGILLLCCQTLNVTVKCLKCQFISSITSKSTCGKCKQEIGLVYVSVLENGTLGFLQFKKCEFVCFNPLRYQFSCLDCHKNYESSEISLGQTYSKKCNKCFKELRLKINKLSYYVKKEVKTKEGEELPEKGTCKHYKKSYRWFRFSCCNSLYPCDICHNAEAGHSAEPAFRMVCGLCSKEQSVKQDCECGMTLKKKNTQFWEGGKGNRDKLTMNRKDNKKYK
ncbi:hypothetical protein GINT2_001099 [Glugoides intestinalis]